MIKTFDGNSFKRVGGQQGDRTPLAGFSRLRVQYKATGGETSINLVALHPEFSYMPGSAQIEVKRSSGGALIAGTDYYESSTTTIEFPSTDPLAVGEIVEITRQVHVSGIAAIKPRPDSHEETATAGQTLVSASFSWPYNMNPCGVQVYFHGIRLRRDVDFTEVNLGGGNTNQIILADAAFGGENIIMEPNYQPIDQSAATNLFNSTQVTNLQAMISAGTQGFVDQHTDSMAVPATAIINRAKIPNLANDLRASMGADRIIVQQIVEVQNEFGPNGEKVYSAVNDDRGLIRFVGPGWFNINDANGQFPGSLNQNDYVEITFYGTGLNLLFIADAAASTRDTRVSINGGADGGNINPTSVANIVSARNTASNQVINIASGLTPGVHTVKVRSNNANGIFIYGFEILNVSANINVNPGNGYINGQKCTTVAPQSIPYKTGFASGTLGTKGGRVVVYQKTDGTIAKAVNPTNAAIAYNESADHANEELVRSYNWREFGAGRSDDFSRFTGSNTPLTFILDDGTTSLTATGASYGAGYGPAYGASGAFTVFTFVGTGCDIIRIDTSNNTGPDTFSIHVDGTLVQTISGTGSAKARRQKIVSGLPYGTHTVRITRTSVPTSFDMTAFAYLVYQPKKPTVPANAIELADYNIMADYSAVSSSAIDTISTGVLRKLTSRELVYANGTGGTVDWNLGSLSGASSQIGGWQAITDRSGAYYEYTFFGTGFDLRAQSAGNRSPNIPVLLNGVAANTTNYPTLTSSALPGASFNASTGILNLNLSTTAGSGLMIRNLPLALYKIRVTNPSTGLLPIEAIDIHSPIHSAKPNTSFSLQNTLLIGSNSMTDARKSSPIIGLQTAKKNITQAIVLVSAPTTTSTSYVPIPDMSVVHLNTGGRISINFSMGLSNTNAGAYTLVGIYVNGVQLADSHEIGFLAAVAGQASQVTYSKTLNVPVGANKIDIYWRVTGGTGSTLSNTGRIMTVEEI